MKNKHKYILAGLLLSLMLGSCEKNVEIDIEEIDPMIVMNGLLQADSTVDIFLSRTRHILDNKELSSLPDATVSITDTEGNSTILQYGSNRLYSSGAFRIIPGKSYTVSASAPGYNPVEATCRIPEIIPVKSIDTTSLVNEWGEKKIAFEIAFDDPEGETNYYMLSLNARVDVVNLEIVQRIDTLYIDPVKDTVVTGIVFDTIEHHYPRYENLYIESEDLAIEQWDYYSNRIIFSDKLFNGRTYRFNGSYYNWFLWDAADSSTVYISLQAIDEHYFKYIDSREDHYYAKDDPFAVPVVVHNNIENGIGILGGMSASIDSFKVAPLSRDWYNYGFD